jgi:hypothetical protein
VRREVVACTSSEVAGLVVYLRVLHLSSFQNLRSRATLQSLNSYYVTTLITNKKNTATALT